MLICNVAPLALILAGVSAHSDTAFPTYKAEITELNGSGVNGTALVFAGKEGGVIGYGGFAEGLASDLEAATVSEIHRVGVSFVKLIDSRSMYVYLTNLALVILFLIALFQKCTATNGCGVHIHTGFGCENTTAQGGHYFVDPVTEDPWAEARYSSGADGKASFSGVLDMGSMEDIEGRAFLGTQPTKKVKGIKLSISTFHLSYTTLSLLFINQSMRRMGHAWDVAC
jgi:hypothetical protein